MKNFVSFSFILFFSTSTFAQDAAPIDRLNYRVTYDLTFQPGADTNLTKNEKMLLLIGDSTSLFFSKNNYVRDSVMNSFKVEGQADMDRMMLAAKNLPRSTFGYSILKQKNSLKTIYQQSVGMDKLSYEEPLTVSEWKIPGETADKAGYQCQKATTSYGGREYEAWFTFEVPLQDGPYKFGGLPGLIVELYDTQDHYHFTLVGFEKVADGQISLNQKKLLNVNRKKFDEMQAAYKADPLGSLTRAMGGEGSITVMDKDGKPVTAKDLQDKEKVKAKSRNNPIELE